MGGRAVAGLVGLALAAALTACTSSPSSPSPATLEPSDVIASLGAVPIPTAGTAAPTPTASGSRAQVLAMGEPVVVVLPGGARALVSATGPAQDTTAVITGPNAHTSATMTVAVKGISGTTTLAAADLGSRDDTGRTITLTSTGARSVSVAAGATKTLAVRGTFDSGSAQLTWSPDGHALAVWVFTIELD